MYQEQRQRKAIGGFCCELYGESQQSLNGRKFNAKTAEGNCSLAVVCFLKEAGIYVHGIQRVS